MTTAKKPRPTRQGIMLCHPVEAKRLDKFPDTFYCQPKLRGERCRVEWFDKEPILVSSTGHLIPWCDHIKEELEKTLYATGETLNFDGELYIHGETQQDLRSIIGTHKKKHPDNGRLEYHIFDIQDRNAVQVYRTRGVHVLLYTEKFDFIKEVRTEITNKSNWLSKCSQYLQDGYEGIVLRNMNGLYESKRSPNILKYKPTRMDAYVIIGAKEGTGWAEGMLGAFIVKDKDGNAFSVGTGPCLTKETRKKYWENWKAVNGRVLLVKHEPITTKNGIPICTVAVEVR